MNKLTVNITTKGTPEQLAARLNEALRAYIDGTPKNHWTEATRRSDAAMQKANSLRRARARRQRVKYRRQTKGWPT